MPAPEPTHRPGFAPSREYLAQLRCQIDYLDSTDPHQRRLHADQRTALIEEAAELSARLDQPDNSFRFRVAYKGTPISFRNGGGHSAFNTEAEAEAYLVELGLSGPEFSVLDCGDGMDAALSDLSAAMVAPRRAPFLQAAE